MLAVILDGISGLVLLSVELTVLLYLSQLVVITQIHVDSMYHQLLIVHYVLQDVVSVMVVL